MSVPLIPPLPEVTLVPAPVTVTTAQFQRIRGIIFECIDRATRRPIVEFTLFFESPRFDLLREFLIRCGELQGFIRTAPSVRATEED